MEGDVLEMFLKISRILVLLFLALLIAGFIVMPADAIISTIIVGVICGVIAGYLNSAVSVPKLYNEVVQIVLIIGFPFIQAIYAGIKTRGTGLKHFIGGVGSLSICIAVVFAVMAIMYRLYQKNPAEEATE